MKEAGLEALIAEWQRRAKRQFEDAAATDDQAGKRLLEHGATCYFNCAHELRALMNQWSGES